MALLFPNQGETIVLEALVNKTAAQDLDLCLYQNDVTPGETDTEASYTVATFTGYATEQLTAASWTTTPGAPTEIAYPLVTFTSTAGSQNQPIYGYYLKQRTSGKLVYAERFGDGPYTIVNNGDSVKVTAKITAD